MSFLGKLFGKKSDESPQTTPAELMAMETSLILSGSGPPIFVVRCFADYSSLLKKILKRFSKFSQPGARKSKPPA